MCTWQLLFLFAATRVAPDCSLTTSDLERQNVEIQVDDGTTIDINISGHPARLVLDPNRPSALLTLGEVLILKTKLNSVNLSLAKNLDVLDGLLSLPAGTSVQLQRTSTGEFRGEVKGEHHHWTEVLYPVSFNCDDLTFDPPEDFKRPEWPEFSENDLWWSVSLPRNKVSFRQRPDYKSPLVWFAIPDCPDCLPSIQFRELRAWKRWRQLEYYNGFAHLRGWVPANSLIAISKEQVTGWTDSVTCCSGGRPTYYGTIRSTNTRVVSQPQVKRAALSKGTKVYRSAKGGAWAKLAADVLVEVEDDPLSPRLRLQGDLVPGLTTSEGHFVPAFVNRADAK